MENPSESLSRHERRELKRAEQRSQQAGTGRRRALRRFMLWGGLAVLIAAVGWLVIRAAGSVSVPSSDGTLSVPVSDADRTKGPADAPITLVEYSDFQCPACAAYSPLVKSIVDDPANAGRIRFAYRHFPLVRIHKNAQQAAYAAEAAGLQGKFWEYHDLLFDGQKKWSPMSGAGARGVFEEYAAQLGLDAERWKSDRDSDAVKDKVEADADSGTASGVDSTPSFFANGKKLAQPKSAEEFRLSILNAAQ